LKRISDAFAFARDGRVLEGTLAISKLDRLHDLLVGQDGEVAYRLRGFKGDSGEPMLHLEVSGLLPLACQRCLEAVPLILKSIACWNLFLLVPNCRKTNWKTTPGISCRWSELDVVELVEDEILLALPVAPRHEKCGLPGAADAGERINPFAKLSGLQGKPN
jgi:uncharacterized protein